MSQLDREGLISQSNFLFPDNTTREITPADLRTFNTDVADSLTITGSLVPSASYAISSSHAVNADIAISASQAENANTATTASHALLAEQAIDVFITVKNTSGGPINKGLAVHATGVTGENINVILADSSVPASMPAIGLLEDTLANNAVGRAIISGRLKNVDTTGLAAGANIFVNGAGTLTVNKPTGSDEIQSIGVAGKIDAAEGEIIIQGAGRVNALPNIQEGYAWVGDVDGSAQAVATSSFAGATIDTGSFATTGSNVFVGDQTISGSTTFQDVNPAPGNTLSVRGGGASPVLDINNSALGTITGADYIFNGNGLINGNTTQNGAGLLSGSLIVKDASGAGPINIFDVNNSTNTIIGVSNPSLSAITTTEVVINTQNGNTRFDGGASSIVESKLPLIVTSSNATTVIKDAQAGPANTFTVNDGSNDIISVQNSALAGIVGSSITVQGNSIFSGNQTISGSVKTEVGAQGITSTTASIDFSDTSLFELTLGSGVDTHIDASNIGRGQTINVLITQDAASAGTVSFSPKFLQPSGSEYTATTTLSGQDILTFITYNDTSKVYVVATNKFE